MRNRPALATIILSFILAANLSAGSADSYPSAALQAQYNLARDSLVQHFSDIQKRSGLAVALEERLDGDASGINLSNKPEWMTLADFQDDTTVLFKLNASLINQLASGNYHNLSAVRGADDTVYKSPADGTMQPLAAYVPASYDGRKPAPLVVFLHGRTWSENDVIATPTVRHVADATGTIVVAPYGRGDIQYEDPASADVYAALQVAERAFNIDHRRVYLGGHSMGGYGVFIVGPKHPEVWTAMLAASGGMVTETAAPALKALQHVPLYLVVGANDPIVPRGYMLRNVQLLQQSGIEAHYYEEAGGLHSIVTISTSFAQAWKDMLNHPPRSTAEEIQVPRFNPTSGTPNPGNPPSSKPS